MRIIATLIAAALIVAATSAIAEASSLNQQAPLAPPFPIAAAAPIIKKPKWEFAFGSPQAAIAPVTTDRSVYVPTDKKLYALDARSGKLQWAFEYDFGNVSRVDACKELVVVGTTDQLIAVEPRTGALVWTYRPGPPTGKLSSEVCEGVYPRLGEDRHTGQKSVYVSVCYAPLVKLSLTGEVIWTAPAFTGGALQFATESKRYGLVFFNSYDLSDVSDVYTRYSAVVRASNGALVRLDGSRKNNSFIKFDPTSGLLFEPWTASTTQNYTISMLSVFELPDLIPRYTLHFVQATRAYYSVTGTALYTMATLNNKPVKRVNFLKYPNVHAIEREDADRRRQRVQWGLDDVYSRGFTSCSKGLINFGTRSVDGYDEKDGSHAWRFEGASSVVAGALIPWTDTVVAVLDDKVVALDF